MSALAAGWTLDAATAAPDLLASGCRASHSITATTGFAVATTYRLGRGSVERWDEAVFDGATSYARALDLARLLRAEIGRGASAIDGAIYAVVDPLFACGCRAR